MSFARASAEYDISRIVMTQTERAWYCSMRVKHGCNWDGSPQDFRVPPNHNPAYWHKDSLLKPIPPPQREFYPSPQQQEMQAMMRAPSRRSWRNPLPAFDWSKYP